jgi:TetR/AcrR family transcriptional regulator, repressor for neighboring sulfatase
MRGSNPVDVQVTDVEQAMEPLGERADARRTRPRRSREQVSQALIDAAASLMAEHASGRVTVRDIAALADVNPTFVHRYFGSKRNLMHAAIERADRHVIAQIEEMPDVVSGGPAVFHAALQEREIVAALARASLDGTLDDLPSGRQAAGALLRRFLSELEGAQSQGRHDPRVIVACLTSATMGYALFGSFLRRGVGLDEESDASVEAAMVAVLQEVGRLAFRE